MKRLTAIAAALVCAACLASASGAEEDSAMDLSGIQVIVVRAGPLDVRVSGGDRSEVSLDAQPAPGFFSDSASGSRVVHKRRGSRLTVWLENDGLFPSPASGQIRVHASRDSELIVETGSGKVFVDSLEGGKCSVRTISGRVRLYRVRGRLSAESVSGSIDLDSTEGGVNARTVSGSITGRGLHLTDDSAFSSISGSIEVELDSALEDLGFDLHSVSGSITVGAIRAERGLRMGFGRTLVRGHTISGSMSFQ
jgi:hypothetical protein